MNNTYDYDISIVLLTYNHAVSIQRAVRSVLSQHIDASVELIISDDASTDETPGLIDEIIDVSSPKYSISVIRNQQNFGASMSFANALLRCRGRYVAYLEGDDYWIHARHLQMLYSQCTSDDSLVAVSSGHQKIRESDGVIIEEHSSTKVECFEPHAGLDYYPLLGASMWRSEVIHKVPDGLRRHLKDTILWYYIAKSGKCVALPYVSLAYVITGRGIHTRLSQIGQIRSHVELYTALSEYETSDLISSHLEFWLWWAIEESCESKDYDGVRHYAKRIVQHYKSVTRLDTRRLIKYSLIGSCPLLLYLYKATRRFINAWTKSLFC